MKLEIKINEKKIYAPLRQHWFVKTPEEEVRQEYICRLVNHYGFSLDQIKQEVTVSNSSRGQGRAQADIVVWKTKEDKNKNISPVIVVECKAENSTIREEDCFQGANYASWAGADFFVTTNLKETRIFKVVKGKIPKQLEEIIDIPKAQIVTNSKKIIELLKQTKAFTRDEFSKLLFICHNIIRNNDKLSPEAAFDEKTEYFTSEFNTLSESKKEIIETLKANPEFVQLLFRSKKSKSIYGWLCNRDY